MNRNVCVVTGTRAEFGILRPLIKKINDEPGLNLQLVVTGAHLSATFGNTQNDIISAGIPIFARIPIPLEGDSKLDMIKTTGVAMQSFACYFADHHPDLLVVLGDRYEIFAASTAAAMIGIPIVHLHGGETTEGAVDEFLRHSITKMSMYHFTACEKYRNRVIQLGESPERVFNYGALGVENIVNLEELPFDELKALVKLDLTDKNYGLVVFHPVTQENSTAEEQTEELVSALSAFPQMQFLIVKANADAGGRTINGIWENVIGRHDNWSLVTSLDSIAYLTALKHSAMIIGNSSSGIIEAPSFRIPTINIGDRQKGRLAAESVISCRTDREDITEAINKAQTYDFQLSIKNTNSPFGDGNTSDLMIKEIKNILAHGQLDMKKKFYDIEG